MRPASGLRGVRESCRHPYGEWGERAQTGLQPESHGPHVCGERGSPAWRALFHSMCKLLSSVV